MRVRELVRQLVEVEVPEDDLITLSEAARMSGRSLQAIFLLTQIGTLPTYILEDDERQGGKRVRAKKYTSKRALQAFIERRALRSQRAGIEEEGQAG